MKLTFSLTRACASGWLRAVRPDPPLAHGGIPYVFSPGWRGCEASSWPGNCTAFETNIEHLVTHLLSPGWCQVLLEAFHWFSSFSCFPFAKTLACCLLKLRRWLVWSDRGAHHLEVTMQSVTKHVCCTRSSSVVQSWEGLGLGASNYVTLTHTLCMSSRCLPHDSKGRTEAVVGRKYKGNNNMKVISDRCLISIGK